MFRTKSIRNHCHFSKKIDKINGMLFQSFQKKIQKITRNHFIKGKGIQ